MGFSRQEYLSGLPFPSPVDHILSDLSNMTSPSWVAPRAWLSFIQLDKAVVHVIRLTSSLWLWLQCICSLMPSCNTYRLGFLLPWAWGISSWLVQQSAGIAPYLWRGVSPHCRPSWPSTWDSSSRPSCAHAAMAPWTWGWSSWPPPLASVMGLLLPAAAPNVLEGTSSSYL